MTNLATASADPNASGIKGGETIPCPVCREAIKLGAKKCINCDSMLDWRRWLGISETGLALMVALVSVVGATAPRIAEMFTSRSSDLRLSIRQVFQQNLELAAWNKGHMGSQLLSARISAKTRDGRQIEAIPLQIVGAPTVPAEQQMLFGLQIEPSVIPAFLEWPHPQIQSATLTVVVNEYKKLPETREMDVPVDYFRLFCRATEDSDRLARHPEQAADIKVEDFRLTSRCIAHPN